MTEAVVAQPIRAADERDIIGRWLQGHDMLRIAADTGRRKDGVADLIRRVTGFDRGRAMQAIRAWDATVRRKPAPKPEPPAAKPHRANESETETRLRQRLAESEAELKAAKATLKTTRAELTAARSQLDAANTEIVAARRGSSGQDSPEDPRVAELEEQLAAAQAGFAAELKQLGKHLDHANEMANLYKARLDRLHTLVGWSRRGNGASILVDLILDVLDSEEPQ